LGCLSYQKDRTAKHVAINAATSTARILMSRGARPAHVALSSESRHWWRSVTPKHPGHRLVAAVRSTAPRASSGAMANARRHVRLFPRHSVLDGKKRPARSRNAIWIFSATSRPIPESSGFARAYGGQQSFKRITSHGAATEPVLGGQRQGVRGNVPPLGARRRRRRRRIRVRGQHHQRGVAKIM
jgi:hypothetical protein